VGEREGAGWNLHTRELSKNGAVIYDQEMFRWKKGISDDSVNIPPLEGRRKSLGGEN